MFALINNGGRYSKTSIFRLLVILNDSQRPSHNMQIYICLIEPVYSQVLLIAKELYGPYRTVDWQIYRRYSHSMTKCIWPSCSWLMNYYQVLCLPNGMRRRLMHRYVSCHWESGQSVKTMVATQKRVHFQLCGVG